MRYREDNELHLDFHGTTNTTLNYVGERFGVDALKSILRKTGRDVYRSIREKLAVGDASELLEHLNWFYYREKGRYALTVSEDRIVMEVFECPAIRQLKKLGLKPSEWVCLQTGEVNAGMCENTPWRTELELVGEGHCIQRFIRERQP
jgi:predicted ArsR family transcriptional regulator